MVVHKQQVMWILTYLWIKATPEAINQHSLPFNLNLALFIVDCALRSKELIGTVVALWTPSELPLMSLPVFG
jgi:hypothetical protein